VSVGEAELQRDRAERRRGLFLALPSFVYMILFFALPLVIVLVYSFATRTSSGSTSLSNWNLDAYRKLGEPIVRNVVVRSIVLAVITTAICLVVAYPFAWFCAHQRPNVRNLLLVAVMIPFWTNFLVRNYAWRILLSTGGPLSSLTERIGIGETNLLFTKTAVVIGLVYAFLPFMILPLYASIDRIDGRLIEAGRDLYGSGSQTFRRIVLPLTMPGVIAGSILVFVPSMGAYVTPELLGGGKETLLGSYIVTQFLTARNWPVGASMSFVLMAVMLVSTIIYFRAGGKNL
jgi:spermidine/putrescine transport system permease protein